MMMARLNPVKKKNLKANKEITFLLLLILNPNHQKILAQRAKALKNHNNNNDNKFLRNNQNY